MTTLVILCLAAASAAYAQGKAQQEATEEQIGNFKKAFSVRLEAKDYLVKYWCRQRGQYK